MKMCSTTAALCATAAVSAVSLGQTEEFTLTTVGSFSDPPLVPESDVNQVLDFTGPIDQRITFNEVPTNTILGDQFSELGVFFNDGNSRVEDDFFNPGEAIVDGQFNFPDGDPTIDISFTLDQTAFAVSYTGDIQFQLFDGETAVSDVTDLFVSTGDIARSVSGVTSETAFNRLVFSRSNGSGPFIDDLFVQNAVPSPAAAGVLALGGLAATRRRR